jgi:hypothetical protein
MTYDELKPRKKEVINRALQEAAEILADNFDSMNITEGVSALIQSPDGSMYEITFKKIND